MKCSKRTAVTPCLHVCRHVFNTYLLLLRVFVSVGFMTFSVDDFFIYSQPFGPVKKKGTKITDIHCFEQWHFLLSGDPRILLKNTEFTPLKYTQLLKMHFFYLKTDLLLP